MIQQDVNLGDTVTYHGSQMFRHGEYQVVAKPSDPNGRGYVLMSTGSGGDAMLYHVHRNSITLKVANTLHVKEDL